MSTQKDLKRWAIISTQRCQREVNQFQSTIKQCLDQFAFNADKPRTFEIKGRDDDFNAWKKTIEENINAGVDFVVFILPGQKGKGKCYESGRFGFYYLKRQELAIDRD